MCELRNRRSFLAMVSGDPIRPPRSAASWASGFSRFHLLYSSHILTVPGRTLPVLRGAVKAQRELEERRAVGPRPRLLVGFRAHEERHQRHVRVDLVIGELLQPLGDGIVIGVHPGMRRVGADELEAERPKTVLARTLDGRKL